MSTQTAAPPYTKRATAGPGRERLRREAIALRRAAHPSVVRLRSFADLPDRTELELDRHGPETLLTVAPPSATAALACGAAVAAAVADLHGLGVVHGRLTPDHVLVEASGRPVLCGLSGATLGDPSVDVRALGGLLELLATTAPRPSTRRDRRAAATLLRVAAHARDDDPAPSAASIAALLGARTRRPLPRVPRRAAAIVAALGLAGAAVYAASRPGGRLPDELTGARTVEAPATEAPAPTEPATPTAPAAGAAPVRLDVGGATYELGQPGDVAVAGDWDCDGTPNAALLRPTSGAVFTFELPAERGRPVAGRPLTTVPGAVGLQSVEQPDGCAVLVAVDAAGAAQVPVGAP